jgi:hypothetical protein
VAATAVVTTHVAFCTAHVTCSDVVINSEE